MANVTLPDDLAEFVRHQKDRQEIYDCLLRYTRGVDRHDKALMASAYHPDAFDEHGVAEGIASDFCDWAIEWHEKHQTKHHHIIVNHSVDLDGDCAHSETYYIFWGESRDGGTTLSFGRYVDRFEKRGGHWAIAHRVCVNEKLSALTELDLPAEQVARIFSTGPSRRDRTDVSYIRPLKRAER